MTSAEGVRPRPARASTWNVANALTLLRLFLVPLLAWLLLRDGGADPTSRVAAFGVFALAMLTDTLDGEVARRRGLVTPVGVVADPIADKALTGTAFVGLSVLGELPWWVTLVVLAREVGITALRLLVIRHGIIAASRGGKAKTALQTVALGLYLLPLPAVLDPLRVAVMTAAVVVTLVSGADYVVRAVRLRRSSLRAARAPDDPQP